MKRLFAFLALTSFLTFNSCASKSAIVSKTSSVNNNSEILPGADQLAIYLPMLKGKKVGIMGNQTSVVGRSKEHLVDLLFREKVDLKFAFAPEHGFRGDVERGEKFGNDVDSKTGLPLYTLYGGNQKQDSIINTIDVMIFDLQDVGARFYTYITSLHRVMELCAKHNKKLIVLDRPNPNGDQVDGPVRHDDKFKSDVSWHKIAMIHGLTIGELAKMVNGEKWLENGKRCDVTVVPVKGYDHKMMYELPVIPSPSLPNALSVRLYLSLCLFEGTDISVGRGTDWPFQIIGYTNPVYGSFTFTPGDRHGMTKHVEGKGAVNYGLDLRNIIPSQHKFTLKYLLDFYNKTPDKSTFFARPAFFDKLAGTDQLRLQILAGKSEDEIRASWAKDLDAYKLMRKKYLIYPDFE
ncbi:exo-beta-N-acetylmuramidase NamZ family protein [Sphingobacterium anhuiense]|uniref:Exo-beta-N-acetylmuramidase NamZ domain-containing protein n=1 Tax=Sphingobacterium anhuiense TaxID=493780 RepID=A0ABW5YYM3_9SPHI